MASRVDLGSQQNSGKTRKTRGPTSGFRTPFTGKHAVKALRVQMTLKNHADFVENCVAVEEFLHGDDSDQEVDPVALKEMADVPSRTAKLRWRIQLDCVAMLAFRARWASMVDVDLYLTYDASPQKTMDISNCAIRVVHNSSWESNAMRVEQRRLPMVVIGSGSFKLVDKTAALLHQLFLEFGPTAASVRRACESVRQAMSDMGTEFGIANAGSCVDVFVRNNTEAVCGDPCGGAAGICDEWLFPRAMQFPGVLDLVDGVLMSTLEGMGWWPHLQEDMKLVTQWLSVDGHRDRLVQHLQKVGEARWFSDVSAAVKLLSKKPESFADWRWRTLQRATGGLLRHARVLKWLVV